MEGLSEENAQELHHWVSQMNGSSRSKELPFLVMKNYLSQGEAYVGTCLGKEELVSLSKSDKENNK